MIKSPFSQIMAYCLLLFFLTGAQAKEPRLDHFLKNLDTFSAGFEQTLLNEYGEEMEKSVGVVYLKKPGKFHWVYYEPYPQFIISDGLSLWIYDKDLDQVTIRDVAGSIEDSPAAVLTGDLDIDKYYVVIDLGTSKGVDWQELTPRDVNSQYNSVRLGFKGDKLVGMILFDNLGQQTRIKFLDTKRNLTLKNDLFEFKPPRGVDVIDERPQR